MDKVNPFTVITAPCPLIFLSNLPKIEEFALVTNSGKISLVKVTARPLGDFLPKLLIILQNSLPMDFVPSAFRPSFIHRHNQI